MRFSWKKYIKIDKSVSIGSHLSDLIRILSFILCNEIINIPCQNQKLLLRNCLIRRFRIVTTCPLSCKFYGRLSDYDTRTENTSPIPALIINKLLARAEQTYFVQTNARVLLSVKHNTAPDIDTRLMTDHYIATYPLYPL